jgi:hypothetical protein
MTASATVATAAAAAASSSSLSIPYLLQRYCHDSPKELNAMRLPELHALGQIGQQRKVRVMDLSRALSLCLFRLKFQLACRYPATIMQRMYL